MLPLLLACASCAWEAGEGFATLEPTARVAFVPLEDREAGEGWQRLDTDFQARITAGSMRISHIELLGPASAGGGGSFDPANPPPGYSSCHGGHCHREDGALVTYEEIEAELGGGGAAAPVVASLLLGDVDLRVPAEQALSCTPDCELPRTELQRMRWPVEVLTLEGHVRDGRASPRLLGERPFRVVLSAPAQGALVTLEEALVLASDRSEPPRVSLALQLDVTARLLDGLDWSTATEAEGVLVVDGERSAPLREHLLENLAQLEPRAKLERSDR
jgi:hypothetical protein